MKYNIIVRTSNDHGNEKLYFTRRGQEIWLKLDLPYVRDEDN